MVFTWNPNPIAISIDALNIHIYWYGIIFASSFILAYLIARAMCAKQNLPIDKLDNLLVYVFIGTLIGARLFHVFFYQPEFYLSHPIEIFCIWKGGLASHGGTIGAISALIIFCRRNNEFNLMWMLDHLSIPTGLVAACIRIGNFMNSEIVGKPTNDPNFGIIFSKVDPIHPLHPVQLYESMVYFSIFLLLLFLYLNGKDNRRGMLFGLFVTIIFSARCVLEIFKEHQAEYENNMNQYIHNIIPIPFDISVGMLLSLPFIIIGILFFIYSFKIKTNHLNKK